MQLAYRTHIVDLRSVIVSAYNFLCYWTKVHHIFAPNARGAVVDHLLFQFLVFPFVPEILSGRIQSCLKLHQILHIFAFQVDLGRYDFTSKSLLLVDQCLSYFFSERCRNCGRSSIC